jgi:hypothetical protein
MSKNSIFRQKAPKRTTGKQNTVSKSTIPAKIKIILVAQKSRTRNSTHKVCIDFP